MLLNFQAEAKSLRPSQRLLRPR